MQIRSVRAPLLSYVFPEPIELSFYGGTRQIVKRDVMLIRVEAANGLTGYAPGEGSEQAARIIREVVAPWLEGRSLRDPDALRVQFLQGPGKDIRTARVYCTVEVALYDLLGKFNGAPVSEMLGGRIRDRVKCYASAGMYQTPEAYAEEAAMCQGLGFPAYKMRPAAGPEGDIESVRRMRAATGAAYGLMVDAHAWWRMGNRSYSLETIARTAEAMGEYDLVWLEEPIPPDDHASYRKLRDLAYVPVAGGEHEPSEASFMELIHGACVDYVQMDVVCQGGYALARRLFGEIEQQNLRFAFHCWGSDLEIAAAGQLGICWPETVVEWMEFPVYSEPGRKSMYEFPIAAEILKDPLQMEDGSVVISKEPGLGVTVDERVIDKYPWVDGPWSYFNLISPPGRIAVTGDHANTGLGK